MSEYIFPDGVAKKIMFGGKGDLPKFTDGGKVKFHYRVSVLQDDGTQKELDDSRKCNSPFELLLGKKFKLDIWETLIKTMRLNEVAEFVCEPRHVGSYPVVSKSLRDMYHRHHSAQNHNHDDEDHHSGHMCGFAALHQGLGYSDLDEYIKNPKPLVFLMELLQVEQPGTYERDLWSITLDEKRKLIPQWKDEGNTFYKTGDLDKACERYSQALGSLEQLSTREKPNSPEWLEIENLKIPLLLNYSQCMLGKQEYYKAIEHLTTVIEKDKNNVKAYYRRGKAHHLVYNFEQAHKDYQHSKLLDESLTNLIDKELKQLLHDRKQKDIADKQKFKNAFA